MAGHKQKPLEETKAYQRRQAATLKRKKKNETLRKRREVAHQAQKLALEKVAEETFGEGGLTPARLEAMSAVLVGADGGVVNVDGPQALKTLINKARKKFLEHAENYIDIHVRSTRLALSAGEFDVAARHAEWAMEALGDDEDRVITRPQKQVGAPPQQLVVGVNLGGLANRNK